MKWAGFWLPVIRRKSRRPASTTFAGHTNVLLFPLLKIPFQASK
jgi:hypothetical protein